MFSAFEETAIDLKDIAKKFNEKELRGADEELLKANLNCYKGCVSILGLLNDKDKKVKFYLDSTIPKDQLIILHPLVNDISLEIKLSDVLSVIEHEVNSIDFSKKDEVKNDEPKGKKEKAKGKNEDKNKDKEEDDVLLGIT